MPSFYNGQAYAVAETEIGIAKEIIRGTAPTNPSYAIPTKAPKYKPNLMIIPDETLQGSQVGVYDYVTGIRYDGHGWSGPPYMNSFGLFLMGELGSPDTVTAAPSSTTLSSAPTVGVASISTAASIAAGSWITMGSASLGTIETHQTGTPTGSGPYTIPLTSPVLYAQPSGGTVSGQTKHQWSVLNSGLGTTVASGSNGGLISNIAAWATPSAGVLSVASSTGFQPSGGTVQVNTNNGAAIITYTGVTSTTLTGCAFVSQTGTAGTLAGGYVGTIGSQPPSFTIWDFDGEEWRQMTACQLDELTIKGNGTSLIEYTCTWAGNPATPNINPPSITWTSGAQTGYVQTPAPWSFYSLLGGPAPATLSYANNYVPTIEDWEFNFKRGVKEIPALTGQQQYFEYFAGPIMTTGKFTFVEQPGSPQLNAYLDALQQSFDFTFFDQRAGAACNLHSTYAQFITGEVDRSSDWVKTPVEFGLLPSTTDATAGGRSPVIATIANAVTTAY